VLDMSEAVRAVREAGKWNAFILMATKQQRSVATLFHADLKAPHLDVWYDDGTSESLSCTIVAASYVNSPLTTAHEIALPVFVEFPRVSKVPRRASVTLTLTKGVGTTDVTANILTPPVSDRRPHLGIAQEFGLLDEGADLHADVIMGQRHLSGQALMDHIDIKGHNRGALREFSAEFWGGSRELNKIPYRGQAGAKPHRMILHNQSERMLYVDESYTGVEGFEPLAPGLGAIRFACPVEAIADGQMVGNGGTGGGWAHLYLPAHLFSKLREAYIRYYIRLPNPIINPKRLNVYKQDQQKGPEWTDSAGKLGAHFTCMSGDGGTSARAGGAYGWQMRSGWRKLDPSATRPDPNCVDFFWHGYDFSVMQPAGHNYAMDAGWKTGFGQRGGFGGTLFGGQWYCVDSYLKVNTVMDEAPGYIADGVYKVWLDGVPVYERSGLCIVTKPFFPNDRGDLMRRLPGEGGIMGVEVGLYHGGVTQAAEPMSWFLSQLVVAHKYIGPMRR
jgi:hypothetical protein